MFKESESKNDLDSAELTQKMKAPNDEVTGTNGNQQSCYNPRVIVFVGLFANNVEDRYDAIIIETDDVADDLRIYLSENL